ncbi:MAM and LDL-receptor class A domain-containing protein 2 [Notolabrus celidotus]|uniref:MAM and LDL-receptor class A domain-containing protein 2 n=1 Tax=Notolabrus celidotus TaxID=1203425 RepID=UPI00148F76BB|nr:MAM and LDL-receptor class A domain-containing protein 2 [Notolabrus celidotus]
MEFCGSCNFENHTCGWNDTSDSYSWRRQLANVTSVPGQDHTTGSPWGHVMHIGGKQGGFSPTATLEYTVDSQAALGCQISFWYHIYDNTSSSWSQPLKLTMVRGLTETTLDEISKSHTDGWEMSKAFIGNQPGGYTLQFLFSASIFAVKDVMLDDISFENCLEGDVPAGSDKLSCDFEKDTCSWYHDYTASLLWERSEGGFFEGPAGNGYYMLISTESKPNISSVARLISFPQPVGGVICVSFSYHIFGNSIGSLKFISKHSGEAETVVWMRSGTQGNKWRFVDLTFYNEKPIQFIIEAVVGGHQGSIAIDNILVTSGENGSCPAERECTFQGSLCGLLPQPSANFTWDRISGATKPSNSSGPSTDHTLGTEQGYYLSAQLWNHTEGSKVAVMTALMEPTPPEGECLMFWYYMEGSRVGELHVYVQTPESKVPSARLWTRRGDQGKHWRHGRVTLLSPSSSYQVVFEAVVGEEPLRDIALDDLTVLNGACPPQGFCDFEMDLCGWVNSPPAESGVDWDWLSGDSKGNLVPARDHTTDSSLGHFVFFGPFEPDREKTSLLESETMEAVDRACLEIWHYANGWSAGPSKITLTVFVNETAELRPVWSTNGYTNRTWIRNRVDYKASGLHQIVLQATCPKSQDNSFALDDIHIIRNMSCEDMIPTTTPIPDTTPTTAPASAMDCTFEQGLCSWVQEVSDDLNWTLSHGLELEQPWDGPQYDHTVGNNQGFFLLLNGSGSKDGERAVISVPVIDVASDFCVRFWYHMLGPSVSSLDLLVQTKSSEALLWTRKGSQNPEWINAQVTISMNSVTQLMFTGHRNTDGKGFIAIDDITVKEGACNNNDACGFDSSLCGFQNDVGHKGLWGRKQGTKSQVDHTYGTENGFYMTVMTSNSTQNEVAQLLTPIFPLASEMCVRFWYWLPAGPSNSLSVHVMRSGDTGDALWEQSEAPSSGWEVAEVTVNSPPNFYVVFRAAHVPGSDSTVKLDDVSVRDGACSPPGSCDFESGPCNWINIHKEGGHEWVLVNGGFHGPPTDHTTQTPEGRFLLSSALHQKHSSVAQAMSEWIHLRDTTSCLTLWYRLNSSDSGTLNVYMRSGLSEQDLVFSNSSSGSSWTRFSQTIERNKPFQLLIEAEANNRGFIAVDDISVTPGICQGNETTSGFVGCSFENGTCGWEDISGGQLQWTRGRNATGNIGPSVDNTLGSELGWYVAVESDRGTQMSPATIQSPSMKQASTTCTLHFYYNMFGEDIEGLRVLLNEGPRSTTLWWLSGNHGDSWHHGEVTVGRTPQDFTILFEASRAFTKRGHIAVDDIIFTSCSLPEPQPECPEDMFKCKNSVCIDHKQRCDFSDDCGDWSDENDCEQQGFEERCSFEQGLCSWVGSDVDTPEAEWTRRKGQEAWPEHGPPRDHTQNSAAGHYVIPGTHLTEKGQTSEILSKTLLPSLNCTVRFFYFSLDDTTARLTAQLRKQRSGSDDSVLWLREDSQSYSWQRAEFMFSSSVKSKIVHRYERVEDRRGLVALDDISFSRECLFDPDNNKLPDTSPTSAPPTPPAPTSTAPPSPCQDDEFFCWRSAGDVCVSATLKCDYHPDCEYGEDEVCCGPCTFERDQCKWTDTGAGQSRWQRQKASNNTEPPTDHTIGTGYYMRVNFSQSSTQNEARLKSPPLPPSSLYCQIKFHFHINAESAGSLRVLMQQADGSEAILWSRSHNTGSHWTPEQLPLGLHQQPYTVWFSAIQSDSTARDHIVAVDDISFLNCEKSYQPPALSACGCSFEDSLCSWVQGAEDELDWLSRSGPTETPNTGPAGDHTTGKGKYIYIKSALPSVKGNIAGLKSSLMPPAGETGYCFTFWFHMFGPTVGSLRMLLQKAEPLKKTLVWQKSGDQGDEWQLVRIHVTLQTVHQVILEATVGGEAGDIAIDDISIVSGPCPASDVCDFEEGSCNWQQHTTDDFDWVRQSGPTFNPNTGPDSDHTTNTPTGHYYFLPSSEENTAGQTAKMSSPLYPAGKGACVQLWYHMYGVDMGSLNIYQQTEDEKQALIFSQTGDQGRLWRFAQASLLPRVQSYRIVVEGVKAGPTQEGDMAFDDVQLTDVQCPPHGRCDFENNICSWTNLGGEVDQGDWLRGRGASPNPNTGPSVDHTTNSTHGYYLYVDSSVGEWGDMSFLISDVFQPSTRGHCLSFWYHMYGSHVGTLRVYINDRNMHTGGNDEGSLKWIETGNRGDKWIEARVPIKHKEAFWFVFVYQRGMNTGGDVALDDIIILPGGCYSEPPSETNNETSVGLVVGVTLLAGIIIIIFIIILNRKWRTINEGTLLHDSTDQTSALDLFESKTDGTHHESDFSFFNNLYDPSPDITDTTVASSDA